MARRTRRRCEPRSQVAPAGVSAALYEGLSELPAFNPDDELDGDVVHPAVASMREAFAAADAVLLCTPEYAGTLPGSLKNLLDWTVGNGDLYEKPVAWLNVAPPGRGDGAQATLATVLRYVTRRRHRAGLSAGDDLARRRRTGRDDCRRRATRRPGSRSANDGRRRPRAAYPGRQMTLVDTVKQDLVSAMRAGEKDRVGALRLILSELQKAAKEGSDDELAVLRRERKRRLESATAFRDGGRSELADGEEAEARLIEGYLPAELSDDAVRAIVAAAVAETGARSAKDMGQVMKVAMPVVDGRADGKRVSALVREVLD